MNQIVRDTLNTRCSAVIEDTEGLATVFISGGTVEELRACYERMQRGSEFYTYDSDFVIYEGGEEVERIPIDASKE